VNPVRNSSGALAALSRKRSGLNPALRGGTPSGAEPGNILKSNPAISGTEEQRGTRRAVAQAQRVISNGVKEKEREGSAGKSLELFIFIDGASRGNPGMAGAGVYITDREGMKIAEKGRFLGHKTNNEAEYGALLLGMQEAKRLGGESIRIYTDSELIERQVKGVYRVKEPHLRVLHGRVMEHIKEFDSFEIESIPREENREADLLANLAIEKRIARERERAKKIK